eukprot:3374024-Amphidinium_carterae.1
MSHRKAHGCTRHVERKVLSTSPRFFCSLFPNGPYIKWQVQVVEKVVDVPVVRQRPVANLARETAILCHTQRDHVNFVQDDI